MRFTIIADTTLVANLVTVTHQHVEFIPLPRTIFRAPGRVTKYSEERD